MSNDLKSMGSEQDPDVEALPLPETSRSVTPHAWVRVGAIAAASAVLGGLATAWFYRKTLSRFRDAGHGIPDNLPNITENETEEDS